MLITAVIATWNEEANIENCLKSVTWCDEIIVVDGSSSDKTAEIAKKYATQVIVTENAPAETQRLKALKNLKSAWFLLLDADERVSPELRHDIEAKIKNPTAVTAYYVVRRNYWNGQAMHLHHPDLQLRLFQAPLVNALPNKIHRIPKIEGPTDKLSGELIHYFFSGVKDYITKLNRYTSIEAEYWYSEGKRMNGWVGFRCLWINPIGRFIQFYFIKKGFLDGFFGFFYCFCSGFYDWLTAVKCREFISTPSGPPK
ncbi:MAG TPA: glycosyltransferase family 2 protein [Candidatus Omnitrophota bacterium]|mgnify:CR=1 FL=1|nr:glycosyltransferase family 2 protein [Candidatus Omnitrophota bacterium]